ncbi:MAG: bifunctional 3-(3-hydroxy-phenyl)propionate/3-hydroxycinnamic acid hydroxylase [Ilumatobacteraceae bacterium]
MNSPMPAANSTVIVVGGGPVGVAAAIALARRGFAVTVVEKATEIYDLPRAIVMDDEVQRALTLIGAGEGLAQVTSPLPGAEFVDVAGTRIIGFELPDGTVSGLGYPPVVRYYQPELEAFLRAHATAAGVQFLLGEEITSVAATDAEVTATLASGALLSADWLIAADGAASPIRKSLGIRFDSLGFDQEWMVVDVRLLDGRDPVLPHMVQQHCDPARPSTFVPGHHRYRRWEFQLQEGETRESMTEPARVWELLSPWLTPDDATIVRAVVYRFHGTVASAMRAGRVFIAGDAAHQMPPFLGQGLCSGVRDAVNLAWKLQSVRDGLAGDRLLDTYDEERRPHSAGVVAYAVDTGRLIDQLAGRGGEQAGLDSAYGGQRAFPHLEFGMRAGDHLMVGRQVPNIELADGRRLDGAAGDGFTVVLSDADPGLADSPALDAWRTLGAIVLDGSVPFCTGAVVVRPDRSIASVSTTSAEFAEHTTQLMEFLA